MGTLVKNVLPLVAALFLLSACNDNQTAVKVGCSSSDGEYLQIGFKGDSDACDARLYVKKQEYADSGVVAHLDAYVLDDREISITWAQVAGPQAIIIDNQALNSKVLVPYVDSLEALTFEVSISNGSVTSTGRQVITVLPLTKIFRPVSAMITKDSTSIQVVAKGLSNGSVVSVSAVGGTAVAGVDYNLIGEAALRVSDGVLDIPVSVLQSGEGLGGYLNLEFVSNNKSERLTFVIINESLSSSAVAGSSSSLSAPSSSSSSGAQNVIPLRFEDACDGVFPSGVEYSARVDNPYAAADLYVDPYFEGRVESTRADVGDPDLASAMELVKSQSTSIWMESVEQSCGYSGSGRLNLVEHIVNAIESTHEAPMTVTLTLYNIPGRELGSRAGGAGDFDLNEQGMLGYKQFINAVAALMASAPEIRFAVLLEPHSLAKLADEVASRGAVSDKPPAIFEQYYKDSLAYAIWRLSQGSNVYTYLDAANPEWVDSKFKEDALISIANEVLELSAQYDGANGVRIEGFVANTLNYLPYEEPFIDEVYRGEVSNISIIDYIDSLNGVAVNFPALPASFVVDSSRNGWGRPDRPTAIGYGKEFLLDNRVSRNSWCNLRMAGMGQFPTANPDANRSYIQAFYWFKPPGESDGDEVIDEYYGCASEYAMPTPPAGGEWFDAHFIQLISYAWPRLIDSASEASFTAF